MRLKISLLFLVLLAALFFAGCDYVNKLIGSGEEKVDQQQLEDRLAQIKRGDQERNTEIAMETPTPAEETPAAAAYDPLNRPDPFRPYRPSQITQEGIGQTPVTQFDVRYFRLVGVVRGASVPYAVIEDPNGRSFIMRVGDLIGKNGGVVYSILDDAIIVHETKPIWGEEGTETVEIVMQLRTETE